jgi:predicted TIM-barrel fold metal-dependent hydrolase
MPKIIDAHSHYMPPEVGQNTAFFKVGWSDIDRHLALMDECGIAKALLLYPTSDAHLSMGGWSGVCSAYNPAIAGVVKAHAGRFIGAGILPVDRPDRFADELKRVQDLGLKVLSLASSYDGVYLDDEKFYPVYAFAWKNQMPVHVHPQIMNPIGEDRVRDQLLTPVLEYVFDVAMCIGKMMMAGVFLEFPDVKFIFAHYGGVVPFVKERFDNTYVMLRKRGLVKDLSKLPGDYFKNLYFDISGTKSPGALRCALEITDAPHILFGSDFPANQNVPRSISVIKNSPLSDEDQWRMMDNDILRGL